MSMDADGQGSSRQSTGDSPPSIGAMGRGDGKSVMRLLSSLPRNWSNGYDTSSRMHSPKDSQGLRFMKRLPWIVLAAILFATSFGHSQDKPLPPSEAPKKMT